MERIHHLLNMALQFYLRINLLLPSLSFAVGGVIAGDFSRYARNRREAVLSSVWGVWPAGVAMLFMGSVMALLAGTYDITQVMSALGAPVLGLIILILATWTTNTINAYSAGIALTNLFQLPDSKRALATAVAGILGTVLAVAVIYLLHTFRMT
jgi:cytosine permease